MATSTQIFVSFADADGDETTRYWDVPAVTSIADVALLVPQLLTLITPLINGRITKAGFTVQVSVPVLVANAASDVQELLSVGARSVNGFLKRMNLPTIAESKVFIPGTKEADRTDTDVDAYLTALINGIDLTGVGGSGVIQFSDGRGEDLVSIDYAVEEFSS